MPDDDGDAHQANAAQRAQQRALAAAVGAHQAPALAGHDPPRHLAHEVAVARLQRHLVQHEHGARRLASRHVLRSKERRRLWRRGPGGCLQLQGGGLAGRQRLSSPPQVRRAGGQHREMLRGAELLVGSSRRCWRWRQEHRRDSPELLCGRARRGAAGLWPGACRQGHPAAHTVRMRPGAQRALDGANDGAAAAPVLLLPSRTKPFTWSHSLALGVEAAQAHEGAPFPGDDATNASSTKHRCSVLAQAQARQPMWWLSCGANEELLPTAAIPHRACSSPPLLPRPRPRSRAAPHPTTAHTMASVATPASGRHFSPLRASVMTNQGACAMPRTAIRLERAFLARGARPRGARHSRLFVSSCRSAAGPAVKLEHVTEKFAGLWTDLEQEKQASRARHQTREQGAETERRTGRDVPDEMAAAAAAAVGGAPHLAHRRPRLRPALFCSPEGAAGVRRGLVCVRAQNRRVADQTRMQLFQESVARLEKSLEVRSWSAVRSPGTAGTTPVHTPHALPWCATVQAEIKRRAESDKQLQTHFEGELRVLQVRSWRPLNDRRLHAAAESSKTRTRAAGGGAQGRCCCWWCAWCERRSGRRLRRWRCSRRSRPPLSRSQAASRTCTPCSGAARADTVACGAAGQGRSPRPGAQRHVGPPPIRAPWCVVVWPPTCREERDQRRTDMEHLATSLVGKVNECVSALDEGERVA